MSSDFNQKCSFELNPEVSLSSISARSLESYSSIDLDPLCSPLQLSEAKFTFSNSFLTSKVGDPSGEAYEFQKKATDIFSQFLKPKNIEDFQAAFILAAQLGDNCQEPKWRTNKAEGILAGVQRLTRRARIDVYRIFVESRRSDLLGCQTLYSLSHPKLSTINNSSKDLIELELRKNFCAEHKRPTSWSERVVLQLEEEHLFFFSIPLVALRAPVLRAVATAAEACAKKIKNTAQCVPLGGKRMELRFFLLDMCNNILPRLICAFTCLAHLCEDYTAEEVQKIAQLCPSILTSTREKKELDCSTVVHLTQFLVCYFTEKN